MAAWPVIQLWSNIDSWFYAYHKPLWVKQCQLHHPPVITIFIGGINKAFLFMGGRHDIVLPTLTHMFVA